MTVYEKYQLLARDAGAIGDRIASESYLQHAEHYYRLMQVAKQATQQQNNGQERQPDQRPRQGEPEQQAAPAADADGAAQEAAASPEADTAAATETSDGRGDDDGAETADQAVQLDSDNSMPMNPADLAAEVEAKSGTNGKEEPAPKRTPRRRRRAPQEAVPQNTAPEAAAPQDDVPQDAAPQDAATEAAAPDHQDSDDGGAVNA